MSDIPGSDVFIHKDDANDTTTARVGSNGHDGNCGSCCNNVVVIMMVVMVVKM